MQLFRREGTVPPVALDDLTRTRQMLGVMVVSVDDSGSAYLVRGMRGDGAFLIVGPDGKPQYVAVEDCTVVQSWLPPDVRLWWDGLTRQQEHAHPA